MPRTKIAGVHRTKEHNLYDFRSHNATTGNIYFVDSNAASGGDGLSPEGAVQTIDAGINLCTASNGDIIYVMEGHTENKTATGAMFTADVAGVRIFGLGYGNTRPTLTFNHTGADIDVTAADVWMDNFKFVCSVADQTHVFDVQAARFKLTNFVVRDDAAADNFIDFIDCSSTTNNNADGLTLINGDVLSDDTGNDGLIEVNADLDDLHIENCKLRLGVASEPVIGVATGKDITNAYIAHNDVYRLNTDTALFLNPDTTDANSGLFLYNTFGHADSATEVWTAATSKFRFIENYATAVDDSSGYLLPAADG